MPNLSTITPVTREEEFLDRIARAAASPNLPEVDTSDNGDVLTVVSGEWAAAAPASGLPAVSSADEGKVLTVVENSGSYEWGKSLGPGNLYRLTVTQISSEPAVLSIGKTYNEILALIEAGYLPFVCFMESSDVSEGHESVIYGASPLTQLFYEVYDQPDYQYSSYGATFGSYAFAASTATDVLTDASGS